MSFSKQVREFFYSLSATDKYSDFDSRKSFNRINKPTVQTSLLYSHHNSSSTVSLTETTTRSDSLEGVHEVRLAWWHVKKWLHKHSQDLNSTLLSPCTESDLSEFQKDLNIHLPKCVEEFFSLTDGQSTFNENGSGGLIYGLRLMSINEIAVMTESWRSVHQSLLADMKGQQLIPQIVEPVAEENADLGEATNSKSAQPKETVIKNKFPPQYSVPPGAVLPIYAHSMWIPLITDGVGNCIAIDLSPSLDSPPKTSEQKWGQVIIFGRDFDIKFKIADNFGDFLLIFANDLEKGNWELTSSSDGEDMICGSDTELIYIDHESKKEIAYLDELKSRATEKWTASLSEEQKALKENQDLIVLLRKKYSIQVPELKETSTDNLINNNLREIDVLNTPIKFNEQNGAASGRDHTDDPLDDDMNWWKIYQIIRWKPGSVSQVNSYVKNTMKTTVFMNRNQRNSYRWKFVTLSVFGRMKIRKITKGTI